MILNSISQFNSSCECGKGRRKFRVGSHFFFQRKKYGCDFDCHTHANFLNFFWAKVNDFGLSKLQSPNSWDFLFLCHGVIMSYQQGILTNHRSFQLVSYCFLIILYIFSFILLWKILLKFCKKMCQPPSHFLLLDVRRLECIESDSFGTFLFYILLGSVLSWPPFCQFYKSLPEVEPEVNVKRSIINWISLLWQR